jgi:hypothetical protein
MPGPINLGGDAVADFAASLAQASKNVGEKPPEPAEAEADGGATDAEEAEGVADDSADGADDSADDPDDAGDNDDEAADGEGDGQVSETVAKELGQLLIDDPAEFFKRTGVDPKVLKINGPKFEAMRKGLREAKDLRAEVTTVTAANQAEKTRLDAVLTDAKQKYGPLVDLKNSLALGDFYAAKELLESLAPKGTTFQQIAEGIVQAAKGISPSEAALRRQLKQEREERAAAEAKAAKDREEAEARTTTEALTKKNLVGATNRLKGTAFDGVDGAAEKLVEIVAANWDYERKGLKIKPEECIKLLGKDPIISKLVELKKLKGKAGSAPAAKVVVRERVIKDKKVDPKAQAEAERRSAMAEATAIEQRTLRTARRGARR